MGARRRIKLGNKNAICKVVRKVTHGGVEKDCLLEKYFRLKGGKVLDLVERVTSLVAMRRI